MRDRPFLTAGEAPRPFSEIRQERGPADQADVVWRHIRELEAEAEGCSDPQQRKRLQCEAEGLRCAIAEQRGGTPL